MRIHGMTLLCRDLIGKCGMEKFRDQTLRITKERVKTLLLLIAITATFMLAYSNEALWKAPTSAMMMPAEGRGGFQFTRIRKEAKAVFSADKTGGIDLRQTAFAKLGAYLLDTNSCKIPNLNPWDKRILHLVKKNPPVDCYRKIMGLTFTKGERIHINSSALPWYKFIGVSCCYSPFYRNPLSRGDKDTIFENDCTPFKDGDRIHFEFIKVQCYSFGSHLYTNFHVFVHANPYKERLRKLSVSPRPKHAYSVLILGIDTMSRLNGYRQMPETIRFLEQRMDAIEMRGYTKMADNTFPNVMAMLTGLEHSEIDEAVRKGTKPLDSMPFLWRSFARRGWSTVYVEDHPPIHTFNYLKGGFIKQPTDFYLRPYFMALQENLGQRMTADFYQCVAGMSQTEVALRWTEAYAKLTAGEPTFACIWISSATHEDWNGGSTVDHLYRQFLGSMHDIGALDNTLLVVMSDHGFRFGAFRRTPHGVYEDRLPMLFVAPPPKFRRLHPHLVANLRTNARRLTTPFDLHATIAAMPTFEGEAMDLRDTDIYKLMLDSGLHSAGILDAVARRALNLWGEVPANRTCTDAGIHEQWCMCRESEAEDTSSEEVHLMAHALVGRLNEITGHRMGSLCVPRSLKAVLDARVLLPATANESVAHRITVLVAPGRSIFEATVQWNEKMDELRLLGDISTLTRYRKIARCVKEGDMTKLCYCKRK